MRDYAKVSPAFWSGDTGRRLRGDADAQRVAFYLITCPSANMIGLYYLPLPTLIHEIGIPPKGALKALQRASEADFAHYHQASEYVWVVEMARFQVGESLMTADNKVKGLHREIESHRKAPFFNAFVRKYRKAFHLESIVVEDEKVSPSEAPPKPLRSQEQEQEIEQEKEKEQKQEQEGEGSAGALVLSFGEFGNARLTAEQHGNLQRRLEGRAQVYIDNFDRWVQEAPMAKTHGVLRKDRDAYASILNWFNREAKEGKLRGTGKQQQQESTAEAKLRRTHENAERARDALRGTARDGTRDGDHDGTSTLVRRGAVGSE